MTACANGRTAGGGTYNLRRDIKTHALEADVGLGDRFKDLTKQAKEVVAERRDEIHEAVEVASVAADRKTRGKHSARIAKFGQKAGDAIDRIAGEKEDASAGTQPTGGTDRPSGHTG
jgi:hypothetical protein